MRLLVMAIFLMAPAVAAAQPVPGPYFAAAAGANFGGTMLDSASNTKVSSYTGPLGLAAFGWKFGNGVRLEIEGSYRSNPIGAVSTLRTNGALVSLGSPTGRITTYAAMANAAYDLPVSWAVRPYLGVGLGYGLLDFAGTHGAGRFGPENDCTGATGAAAPGCASLVAETLPDTVSFGAAGALAWQVLAGAAWEIPGVNGWEATLEYRYFGMAQANIPVTRVATDPTNGSLLTARTHNGFTIGKSSVLVGLRYSFATGGRLAQ